MNKGWPQDSDYNANAECDSQDNEIGLRKRFFGGIAGSADRPDNKHDQVYQGNRENDECENPVSNGDGFVFGVTHSQFLGFKV
jgi:hypothetical protein